MSDLPSVGELVTNDVELYVAAASAFETSATVNLESICFSRPSSQELFASCRATHGLWFATKRECYAEAYTILTYRKTLIGFGTCKYRRS